MKRRLVIIAAATLAMGMALAGLALATAGSGIVSVEYGRHTVQQFSTKFTDRDIVVSEVSLAPGGYSGWHSHPGKVIVAVSRGSITIYHSDGSTCVPTTYSAGDLFVEHAGSVHEARNEGTVAAVLNITYLSVPVGTSPRIDEAQPPAGC
ncbi:MAG: cupin domain-containing protein [Actinomycetota bacterium]